MSSIFWTEARVMQLKQLRCVEGKTCDAIAGIMGVTKNAIIGKCVRDGIEPSPNAPLTNALRKRLTARPHPTSEDRLARLNIFPAPGKCVYPLGNPGAEGFHFCGETAWGNYCPEHHEVCFIPVSKQVDALKQINYAAGKLAMVAGLK